MTIQGRPFAAFLAAFLCANASLTADAEAMTVQEDTGRAERLIADLMREPDREKQQAIHDLIIEGERIVYEGSRGGVVSRDYDRAALERVIGEIEALSGIRRDPSYFVTAHGGDLQDDANFLAAPRAEPVSDLTDDEIEALVSALKANIGSHRLDRFIWFLGESLGPAFSSDLIFWAYGEWTDPELVAEIRHRQSVHAADGIAGLQSYELAIARRLMEDPETDIPRHYWAEGVIQAAERRARAD